MGSEELEEDVVPSLILTGRKEVRQAVKRALEEDDRTRTIHIVDVDKPDASWRMLRQIGFLLVLQDDGAGRGDIIAPLRGEVSGPRIYFHPGTIPQAVEHAARRIDSQPRLSHSTPRPIQPHGPISTSPSGV